MLENIVMAFVYVLYICIVCFYDIRYRRVPLVISNPVYWLILSIIYFIYAQCNSILFLVSLLAAFSFSFYLFKVGFWGGGDGKVFVTSFIFSAILLRNPVEAYLYNVVLFTASTFLMLSVLVNDRKMALAYFSSSLLLFTLLPALMLTGAVIALVALNFYKNFLMENLNVKKIPLTLSFLVLSIRISSMVLSG